MNINLKKDQNANIIVYDKPQCQDIINIIVIGDSKVGKSSFIQSMINNKSNSKLKTRNIQPTLGVDIYKKILKINKKYYILKLYDTSADGKLILLTENYYRYSDGVIVMFDLKNNESFKSLDYWFNNLYKLIDSDVPVVLVGNKCDGRDIIDNIDIMVDNGDINTYAEEKNIKYFSCSSINRINIDKPFNYLINQIIRMKSNFKVNYIEEEIEDNNDVWEDFLDKNNSDYINESSFISINIQDSDEGNDYDNSSESHKKKCFSCL